jgi:hypothetical protein
MNLHHFVTCTLLAISYISLYNVIGIAISFLHDFADVFTFSTKLFSNMRIELFTTVSALFCLLAWGWSRIYVLPFYIYYGTCEVHEGYLPKMLGSILHYQIYGGLLSMLYILHCYWTFLLVKKIVLVVLYGDKVDDH